MMVHNRQVISEDGRRMSCPGRISLGTGILGAGLWAAFASTRTNIPDCAEEAAKKPLKGRSM